jgi:RNA polymerase sigma-B factor
MLPNFQDIQGSQGLGLLKAYQELPSAKLQKQLVSFHIDLVHTVIDCLPSQSDRPHKDLVKAGSSGLKQAFKEYNLHSEQNFEYFAVLHIHEHIQIFLKQQPIEPPQAVNLATNEPSLPPESEQSDFCEISTETFQHQETPQEYHSFRLAKSDTEVLQKVLRSLESRALKKPEIITPPPSSPETNSPKNNSDVSPEVVSEARSTVKASANTKSSAKAISTSEDSSADLKQETLEILQAYRQEPTPQLRNRLVKLNLGLVRKEAYHWVNQCTEGFEDLMQVGSIGLIRAIERFDMERGHAFSSFAVPYIRGEIQHYLRDKSPTLRVPRSWLTIYNQACKTIRNLRAELRREPSDAEIAKALDIPVIEWQEIKLACQNRAPISLDAPVGDSDDDSTLGDLMTDTKYRSFQLAQEDGMRLQQALDLLEDRTRQIVEFVFLKEFTHKEVAETLGISVVTVSRQVKKGIGLLKNIMTPPSD